MESEKRSEILGGIRIISYCILIVLITYIVLVQHRKIVYQANRIDQLLQRNGELLNNNYKIQRVYNLNQFILDKKVDKLVKNLSKDGLGFLKKMKKLYVLGIIKS